MLLLNNVNTVLSGQQTRGISFNSSHPVQEMSLIVIFFAVLLLLTFLQHYRESSAFPPGYVRWPFLGSVLSFMGNMGSDAIITSSKDAHKYNGGKFMGIFIGPNIRAVFVFDYNVAKEIVFSDKYIGKYGSDYAKNMRGYHGTRIGVIQTEGQTWKMNRRFSLSTLRGNPNLNILT